MVLDAHLGKFTFLADPRPPLSSAWVHAMKHFQRNQIWYQLMGGGGGGGVAQRIGNFEPLFTLAMIARRT